MRLSAVSFTEVLGFCLMGNHLHLLVRMHSEAEFWDDEIRSSREEMMSHPIYRVRSFERLTPYTLRIRFDDDTERTIDFRPILAGELYGPLRDPVVFNQVQIDPEVHTLVWPNGADFDPATLHDWPQHCDAVIARARQWESGSEREQERA